MQAPSLADHLTAERARPGRLRDAAVALHFGDAAGEYRRTLESVGVVDRSHLGRLRLTGTRAADLLHRLSTRAVRDLTPGDGCSDVLTTGKGRIVDWLRVYRDADGLWLVGGSEHAPAIVEWIRRYVLREDVRIEDSSAVTSQIALVGPGAAAVAAQLWGDAVTQLPRHHWLAAPELPSGLLTRGFRLRHETFEAIVPRDAAADLWRRLVEAARARGGGPVGEEAYEVLRVEAGLPVLGAELGEAYNPLEANLWGAVDFDKGCYIGQEVVARLNTYKKVSRSLVRLEGRATVAALREAEIRDVDRSVGQVTSAVAIPGTKRTVALGYVATAQTEPQRALIARATGGDEHPVRVIGRAGSPTVEPESAPEHGGANSAGDIS